MNRKGFTLIELLIVVVIVGILIAIGVQSYQSFIKRTQYTALITEAGGIKKTLLPFGTAELEYQRIKDMTGKDIAGAYKESGEYLWRIGTPGDPDTGMTAGNGEDMKTKVFPAYEADKKFISGLVQEQIKWIESESTVNTVGTDLPFKKGSAALYHYPDGNNGIKTVMFFCGEKGIKGNDEFKNYVSKQEPLVKALANHINTNTKNGSCLPFPLN